MKENRNSMASDIAYMFLILLLFLCTAFVIFSENTAFNTAALCLVLAILIVAHFTSVTLGLILNVAVIFAGFSWYLYQAVSYGRPVQTEFYFWAVISPILTVTSHMMFRNMKQLEAENISLRKRVRQFSVIDDVTELKNIQAYEMEFPVYQRIAQRYKIGLMLILWQFRYADDLEKILGKKGMEEAAVEISRVVSGTFRREDVIYILSKSPYVWGSLLLSNENSEELLKKRIKESLEKQDYSEILGKNAPKLEVRVGVFYAGEEEETALSMLDKAQNSLQYDV